MRIIVSGATGYIGTKLVKRLEIEGYEVYIIARKNSNVSEIGKCVKDIFCPSSYLDNYPYMEKVKPEVYINLAGYYCSRHSSENVSCLMEANIILPTYLTDAAVCAGCVCVIHTASYQQCYHGERYNPINLYAATKQSFEDILYYYTSLNKISAVTLQLFDTYGADDTRNKIFNLVRRLHDGDSINMSPGLQKLYLCYIDDVIEAYMTAIKLVAAMKRGMNKRYAVRDQEPITLKEFVEYYKKIIGKNINLNWGERQYVEREIMDPSGYGEVLPGWSPKISYWHGIQLCGEYDLALDS